MENYFHALGHEREEGWFGGVRIDGNLRGGGKGGRMGDKEL